MYKTITSSLKSTTLSLAKRSSISRWSALTTSDGFLAFKKAFFLLEILILLYFNLWGKNPLHVSANFLLISDMHLLVKTNELLILLLQGFSSISESFSDSSLPLFFPHQLYFVSTMIIPIFDKTQNICLNFLWQFCIRQHSETFFIVFLKFRKSGISQVCIVVHYISSIVRGTSNRSFFSFWTNWWLNWWQYFSSVSAWEEYYTILLLLSF